MREFFLKVCNTIHSVKVIVDLGLDVRAADFAFTNPQEPFFVIVALQQLHADKCIPRLRCELNLLSGQFTRVFLIDGDIFELALRINFELRHNVFFAKSFSLLCLLFKFVKFRFRA